jgi:hypothetical protein
MKQTMDKPKRYFHRNLTPIRRHLSLIRSGDWIDYKNMSLISRFISEKGKIFHLCYPFFIIKTKFIHGMEMNLLLNQIEARISV